MRTDDTADILRCEIARTGNYGYFFEDARDEETDKEDEAGKNDKGELYSTYRRRRVC